MPGLYVRRWPRGREGLGVGEGTWVSAEVDRVGRVAPLREARDVPAEGVPLPLAHHERLPQVFLGAGDGLRGGLVVGTWGTSHCGGAGHAQVQESCECVTLR